MTNDPYQPVPEDKEFEVKSSAEWTPFAVSETFLVAAKASPFACSRQALPPSRS